MTFGERLTAERVKKRLKIGELSELSGIAKRQLHTLQRGQARPTLINAAILSTIFEVPVDYLVSGKIVPFGNRNESPCLNFPERFVKAREAKGYSRYKFAKCSGVSYGAIMSWEHGNSYPIAETAAAVADMLGVSLEWLVFGERGENEKQNQG